MLGQTTPVRVWLNQHDHLVGGFVGGIVSTTVCHPLDLLRIRYSADRGRGLQIQPRYNSYLDAAKRIFRAEGVRGLYQGVSSNMVARSLSWALYLQWFHKMREILPVHTSSENLDNFLCAVLTGSTVMCITNPIWVTKTRLCLQYETAATKKYTGMVDCLVKLYRGEGVRGLYRGFLPGLVGTTQQSLYLTIYTRLKAWRCQRCGLARDSQLSSLEYLVFSGLSKCIATTLTFPYQLVRTRMQDHNIPSGGAWRTIADTLKLEGIRGLYKGCLMANIRQVPAAIVTFVTYENVRSFVKNATSYSETGTNFEVD
ncbi:hypothetical protein Y032_0050g1887 [Ancylostoma ceylanicum]|uniref:Mitochondrial carrier protein n=1 Tax=Ancylostoma ceylanicum TaxID=53326 RepID=A0A016U872_9BILA|nr:hypothetical protein Y032_0050g1887 [Ancylostoma ceylanicum]